MTRLMVILGVVLSLTGGVTTAQDAPAPSPLSEVRARSKAVLITGWPWYLAVVWRFTTHACRG